MQVTEPAGDVDVLAEGHPRADRRQQPSPSIPSKLR